jgi:hypothetical protein
LVNGVNAELFQPLDFIRAEALGMDTPARGAAYRNCRECKFWADSITFKENKEYEVILNGLHLDKEKKKWTAPYPFCVSPWTLINNYSITRPGSDGNSGAVANKVGQTGGVQRPVLRHLLQRSLPKAEPEEDGVYTGPVNHITIVDTLKSPTP